MSKSYTSMLSWFGLTLAASLMLFHTSDRVTALQRQLNAINAQIAEAQETRHVLNAEWVYLSNPARVAAEVKDSGLGLQPTPPARVTGLTATTLASLLPLRGGIEPAAATQLAAVDAAAPAAAVPRIKNPTTDAVASYRKHDRLFAAVNAGHLSDHMILQHNNVAQASTDTIGALIDTLSLKP